MRGTQVAQRNAWHTIRASKKCELLLSFITHALAAPPFTPCKTLEPHFYFPGRKFLSHFRVAPSPPIKTFFRPGQAKAPHPGGKKNSAGPWEGERAGKAGQPAARGPRPPRSPLGPGAEAAARSRPTWPLGAARARGGHGHARQPGGGEPPRARAAACVR